MSKIKQPYILIFKKNSIKNQYLGVFKNFKKHKQNMIFHVVAIRDLFWKNYSIDVLFFWLSEERVRDILRAYKLVALQLYEYKEDKVRDYWKVKILINFEWQDVRLLSNSDDMDWLAYWLSVIWFDIKNINYAEAAQVEQAKIDKIIENSKKEAKLWIDEQNQKLLKKKEEEDDASDERKREKYQLEINKLLSNIQRLTIEAKDVLPKERLKTLFRQWQELSKLKMWRNFEKIAEMLEIAYSDYSNLEQEYLNAQQSSKINVSWSKITDTYVIAEIQKLERAKWMANVWSQKWTDVLTANFGWFFMYVKFLSKDIWSNIKHIDKYFSKIFWDLLFWIVLLETAISIYHAIYVCFYINVGEFRELLNYNIYVFLVKFWVFGLVLYGVNHIKKWSSLVFNILLLLARVAVSLLLILVLKQNFIF